MLVFPPANTPDSLLKLACNYVVTHDVPFHHIALPIEICDALLKDFRDLNANSKDAEKVSKFISQFKTESTPLSYASLSRLPIRDRDIQNLLSEHYCTLKHLDIDGCYELTEHSLHHILTLSNRINDFDHIIVTVKITERTDDHTIIETLLDKKFEKGIVMSALGICESAHVGYKQDLLSIFESMDVFDYGFDKLRQELTYVDKNNTSGSLEKSFMSKSEKNEPYDRARKNIKLSLGEHSFSNTPIQEPTVSSYIMSDFVAPAIISQHLVEPTSSGTQRHLEYKAWRQPLLESLILGNSSHIFPGPDFQWKSILSREKLLSDPHLSLKILSLQNLSGHGLQSSSNSFLDIIFSLTMSQTLTYLDLSNSGALALTAPLNLQNLRSLVLYNTYVELSYLKPLKKLRVLDISTSYDRRGYSYECPDQKFSELVVSLPELTHLDISGTNLDGERSDRIMGLESRQDRPLEFLGVYGTSNDGSFRQFLPAIKVAGEANEQQILTACEAYMDRSELLNKALNDLFHCFRHESDFHDITRSLNVVLMAMERHSEEKPIQIAASASLFYMVKSDEAKNYSPIMKRPIVSRLLDAMQRFQHDITMLRNGSLTLIHFKLPQDVLFEYTKVLKLLLFIVRKEEEEFIQRLGIYLLNSLACQVDGEQKTLVGDLGAIEKLVKLIWNKLEKNQCDEVMETAWSTIWNVTDENPRNCERFLNNSGMDLFIKCVEAFPDPPELLRNMMGLLGNVAECENLRPKLMKADYIERFRRFLGSDSDGIEVSYNAAGILSHIVSDGEEVWNQLLSTVDRSAVLERMRFAISRWQINSKRNINYRSFEPILRLLKAEKPVYEAQYWAVWALANLTRVYSPKYCPLLIVGGGVEILYNLTKDEHLPDHVRKLVDLTLYQVNMWNRHGSLDGLEGDPKIDIEMKNDLHDDDNDSDDE